MKSRLIQAFCKQEVKGWDKVLILEEQLGFVNAAEGIHLITSIVDYNKFQLIHVSLTPISTISPPITVEEVIERTPQILFSFFGDREFCRQPDDERRPAMKHYFSLLKDHE